MTYLSSLLLIVVLGATVIFRTQGAGSLLLVSSVAIVLFLGMTWKQHSRAGKIFIIANLVLIAAFWGRGVDQVVIETGFDRVSLFSAFMIALLFLRLAAKRSAIIAKCGHFLVNQRPSARYAVLSYGSWLIGAVLSFGALNLMGQVISSGNTLESAKGDARIHQIRKKRMVLAMMRGFGALPLSSPFSISMALMLSLIPTLRWQSLLPLTLGVAISLIALGWLMDTRAYAYAKARAPEITDRKKDISALLKFILIVIVLFGASATFSQVFGYGLPTSILIMCPIFGILWFMIEGMIGGASMPTLSLAFPRDLMAELGGMAPEIAVIGGASFLGALVSGILEPQAVQTISQMLYLHGYPLALFCMMVVVFTSLFGVSPFVSVSILGATFSDVTVFGLSPYVLSISLLIGWFLALNASPLTISAIMVGRILGCEPKDITLRWNGRYSIAAAVFGAAVLYGFHILYD
jgi:hypothetical protein